MAAQVVALPAFLRWLEDNNVLAPKIEVRACAYGLGIFATEELSPEEPIVTLPKSLIITYQQALNHKPFSGIFESYTGPSEYVVMLMLIHGRENSACLWKPYLDLLPRVHSTTLFFSEAELSELEGTNLHLGTVGKREQLVKDFDEYILPLVHQHKEILLPSLITFENFLWAHAVYWSRVLPVGQDRTPSLVPLCDILNHQYRAKISWFTGDTQYQFISGEKYNRGDEVFNNYGGKGNDQFLLGYGFTIPNNSEDSYYVHLGIRGDDDSTLQKTRLLERFKQDGLGFGHYLHRDGVNDPLLASLRICVMTPSEVYFAEQSPVLSTVMHPINSRNELEMMAALLALLNDRLSAIRGGADPAADLTLLDQDLNNQQLTPNQRNAIIYRVGQKQILLESIHVLRTKRQNYIQSLREAVDPSCNISASHFSSSLSLCSADTRILEEWVTSNGGTCNIRTIPVDLSQFTAEEVRSARLRPTCQIALQDLSVGDIYARFPYSLLITSEKAKIWLSRQMDSSQDVFAKFQAAGADNIEQIQLMLFLIHHKFVLKSNSPLATFFSTVPDALVSPLFLSADELAAYPSPYVGFVAEILELQDMLMSEYRLLFPASSKAFKHVFPRKHYTMEMYTWAYLIVSSRSIRIMRNNKPEYCMIPMDLTNENPAFKYCHVWDEASSSLTLFSYESSLAKGDMVLFGVDNCVSCPDSAIIYGYLTANVDKTIPVKLFDLVEPNSFAEYMLKEYGIPLEHYLRAGVYPTSLLAALRVLVATVEEMESIRRDPAVVRGSINEANDSRALAQLKQLLCPLGTPSAAQGTAAPDLAAKATSTETVTGMDDSEVDEFDVLIRNICALQADIVNGVLGLL
eukprot:GILK01010140.1.p1 GENE.GILK01010140.1~~GILK01010140.1.p1  ORF type:complete len:858 (+),score=119.24 GILK01010140.1:37-2610(+)